MADSVEPASDTAETEVAAPKPEKQKSLARIQAVPWLIVILLIAATVWLFWRAFIFQEEGDPVGSAMLAFEKQNSLTVFSSRFEVTAESTNTTSLGPINLAESRQAAIIPVTIEYRVNLASVGRDRIAWDADTETMDITLPTLKISTPNLDEARKKVYTEGVWVSRGASENLSRENSLQAEEKAAAFAKNPEVLALARQAAKDAIRQNLTIPLQVAGYDDITVNVRFDGEKVQE
ncbi:DUF4230 domain-containing protein [Pontixanthobacter aestiaquae]|uniref:DUF4230 domain-containing protein n=1 Tax=Pontixanthobacter aestiaquae TaxID=1509367 RepID=A0A844Z6X1_9SPHN|nr:DUF4230 domain-containing protein [Pontixanthobacter aestiaquae]MDN3646191.1 DUF4230 domain-containing protein [Pontixanthobacter aestiaquae]MXO82817.1 DUF4230 domain-containing protein [Pontixanthobacter aestiaquae]